MDRQSGAKKLAPAISFAVVAVLLAAVAVGPVAAAAASATGALPSAAASTAARAATTVATAASDTSADQAAAPTAATTTRLTIEAASAPYSPSTPTTLDAVPYTDLVDCGDSTCQLQVHVVVPSGPGPYPTAVLVHEGPYLDSFAESLASAGILIFAIDVRMLATQGGGSPQSMQDVACGIRYARAVASTYGGDGDTVTLVGHSFGAYIGSVVAVNAVQYQGGCLYGGNGRPDAFVGFSGNYELTAPWVAGDFAAFFGGSAAATAQARAGADPFACATGSSIPVRLVAGSDDETVDPTASASLASFLAGRGWDVDLDSVEGGSHMSILDSPDALHEVFAAIVAADASTASAASTALPSS